MKYILSFFKFWLNPIIDDWNGGVSLIRLTFIAMMYGIYHLLEKNIELNWTYLLLTLFLLIYLCFKGDAAPLISQLLNLIGSLKNIPADLLKDVQKNEEPK